MDRVPLPGVIERNCPLLDWQKICTLDLEGTFLACFLHLFDIICTQTVCSFLCHDAFIGKRSKCDLASSPVNLLLMKLAT